MAELHIRNLPPELHQRLRERATSDGRSMSAEVVTLLRDALQPPHTKSAQQRAGVERLRDIRGRNDLPDGAATAEQLVREDRDSAW